MKKLEIDDGQWYSAREAADFLGKTAETVKGYVRKGILKGKQVGLGKVWKFLGADLKKCKAKLE